GAYAGKDGLRKSSVQDEARTNAPSANHVVQCIAYVFAELLAMAERQFVNHVAVEQMLDVLRATTVVADLIVRFLWECPSADRLPFHRNVVAKLAEETGRVAQALGPGVVDLRLQTVIKPLLQSHLQRVIVGNAIRRRIPALSRHGQ